MNKNLVFRILGIVSGLLVIVSLFLPYFSLSLWALNAKQHNLYLSVVMIVFAVLPIILYAINKKMEFAYMSVGALAFFLVTQIVDALSSNNLGALGIGFYLLIISVIMMAVSTLILSKGSKINVLNEQITADTNNISDPLKSNGVDAQIAESKSIVDEVSPNAIDNSLEGIPELSSNNELPEDNNSIVDSHSVLGEEIPEFQSEDGINPVISEFTSADNAVASNDNQAKEAEVPSETPVSEAPVSEAPNPVVEEAVNNVENPETVSENLDVVSEQPAGVNPALELANDLGVVPEQQNTVNPAVELANDLGVPATAENEVGQAEVVNTPPQNTIMPEITFDEPKQEVPESQEPQFDVFGQPR